MVSEYIRGQFRIALPLFLILAALSGGLGACMKNEPTTAETDRTHRQHWRVPQSLPGAPAFPPTTHAALARALARQPADYSPRTHHRRSDGGPKYTNRLIQSTSPYLLQHAHNPVSWYPWGEEAFARAKAENRPVFLSVGYSTCHWCHVMEGESFEDEEIARILNERFIPIKVDRE